ncbi:MAG: hypothetical protein ACI944_000598, partial [Natronomonas sp.]
PIDELGAYLGEALADERDLRHNYTFAGGVLRPSPDGA